MLSTYIQRDDRLVWDEFVDAGDRVVARCGPLGPRSPDFTLYQVVTVRDGRIVHMQDFEDRDKALGAAGVLPVS